MEIILLLIGLPGLIIFINFTSFLIKRKMLLGNGFMILAEIGSLFVLPYMYAGFGKSNRCCADEIDTAAFSPAHQLTIAVIILLSLVSYVYSRFRTRMAPPVIEVLVNVCLLIGIVLNFFLCFHTTELALAIFGSLPVMLLGILMLIKNQALFMEQAADHTATSLNRFESLAWKLLTAEPIVKFPLLLVCCLPVLVLLAAVLLLFGQKPDSMIRAFTDTYKHGLSQWDHQCDNVACGGHYLCSVAANGHSTIVKPQRLGIRNNNPIICNRQLLISNAFEDLIQERMPSIHRVIRQQYNKVGEFVHHHYHIFNIKFVSDSIYLLMKPLEWLFLLTLYTFDRKPENRIEKQYISTADRSKIEVLLFTQINKSLSPCIRLSKQD
jgi:hypothetical protein